MNVQQVAIEKRVVGYDAKGVSARLFDDTRIQVHTTEGLKWLLQRGIEKPFVAQTIKPSEPLNRRRMDGKNLFSGEGQRAHLASSSNTSAYSSIKSTATSVALSTFWAG